MSVAEKRSAVRKMSDAVGRRLGTYFQSGERSESGRIRLPLSPAPLDATCGRQSRRTPSANGA